MIRNIRTKAIHMARFVTPVSFGNTLRRREGTRFVGMTDNNYASLHY